MDSLSLRPCRDKNLIDNIVKDPQFKIKLYNNLDRVFKLNEKIELKPKKKMKSVDKKDYINYFVNRFYHVKLFTDNICDITSDEESSEEDDDYETNYYSN